MMDSIYLSSTNSEDSRIPSIENLFVPTPGITIQKQAKGNNNSRKSR